MLENLIPPSRKKPCKVRTLLEDLEPGDREILEAAVMDYKKWQVRTLTDELRKLGLNISDLAKKDTAEAQAHAVCANSGGNGSQHFKQKARAVF